MRFVVSYRFVRHADIKKMGKRYFKLLPLWVQNALKPQSVIIIAPSSDDAERIKKSGSIRHNEKVFTVVFGNDIKGAYVELFTQIIKCSIDIDPQRRQLFHRYVQNLYDPCGFLQKKDVASALYTHLTLYLLRNDEFLNRNEERRVLCEEIVRDINALVLPYGALQ